MLRFVPLAVVASLAVSSSAKAQCAPTYFSFGSSCYTLTTATGYAAAQAESRILGGYLVHINSAAENTFVFNAFGSSSSLFIGLTDQITEGVWIWDDGLPLLASEALWGPGEPNNASNEDFVHFRSDGLWNDIGNNQYRGIVEIAQTSSTVPEPMTVTLMGTGLLGIMGAGYARRRREVA
jgi:hypothetical protein